MRDFEVIDPTKSDVEPWVDIKTVAQHTGFSESFWEKHRLKSDNPKWACFGNRRRTKLSWVDAAMVSFAQKNGEPA